MPLPKTTRSAPTFAVVDVETTGLSYNSHHRIIEIGVVLLDSELRPEQHWETLLNPNRDIGATRIHGIRARDLLDAPEFTDIAEELAALIAGRILIAHNAVFDTGFIASEYRRLGVKVGDLSPSSLCTMRLAPHALAAPARTLEACCAAAGIVNTRAHAALADADATARLFGHLSSSPRVREEVFSRIPLMRPAYSRPTGLPGRPRKTRTDAPAASPPDGWIARIASTMPRMPVGPAEECYLAVLDRALVDRHLDGDEKTELLALASALNLDRQIVLDLHSRYLDAMSKLALADGVVTSEERADLELVALQLGLSVEPSGTTSIDSAPSTLLTGLLLAPGDRVTLTGETIVPRGEWERQAMHKGLDVGGVTKKSKVLMAADPDSMSGKAKKAREYGVPIVDEDTFAILLGSMQ